MRRSRLSAPIAIVLSLQIGVGTSFASDSSVQSLAASLPKTDGDPIRDLLVETPNSDLRLNFDPNDPALDQDPFFLREQSWSQGPKFGDLGFAKENGVLNINVPGSTTTLRLNLSMTPVHLTDEYIFLSLDPQSDLFERAAGSEAPGEGLFFISRTELTHRAVRHEPVPIFFLPFAGHGWKGPIDAVDLPESDTVVLGNREGESVALELKDVDRMMKGQQINLLLATAFTAKNRGVSQDKFLFPMAGTTMAFGLYFTGLDLQNPSKSEWALKDREHSGPMLASWLKAIMMPEQARAVEINPDLIYRLEFVSVVLVGMLAASFVLKHAHPGVRAKILGLRAGAPEPTSRGEKFKRWVTEGFGVYAHVLTTSAQFAQVTFGNALELFLDRFAPTVAAADHTLVRRALKNTFYFARDSVRNSPVSAKTLVLGSLVMGGIDTAFVAVQYEIAVPWICQGAGHVLPADWNTRINATFDPGNPNTTKFMMEDTVRTGILYAQSGASNYSSFSRAQVISGVTSEIDHALRAEGKDPGKPENQAEREKRIEEKVSLVLTQRGLPGQKAFLFDATSAFASIGGALGYKAPTAGSTTIPEAESFILAKRFGLSQNALHRALDAARAQAALDGSQTSKEIVAILEETLGKMSFVAGAVGKGREGIAVARRVREQLTLLSYEGPLDWAVRYVPEAWQTRFSPEAANGAGLYFRQALYSYLAAEGDSLIQATPAQLKDFSTDARAMALRDLRRYQPQQANLDDSTFIQKNSAQYRLLTQLAINQLARERAANEKTKNYVPPKADWLARRKQNRAETRANERLAALLLDRGDATVDPAQIDHLWTGFYRDEMAAQVGLHLETVDEARAAKRQDGARLIEWVENQANEMTKNQLANDEGLRRYVEGLTAPEQRKLKASIYANNYLQAYKQGATEHNLIPAMDPQQPGRWQRLRRTPWVRENAFLTSLIRANESLVSDQALGAGWKDAFARNVPLFDDLWSSHIRLTKTILPSIMVLYTWNYFMWQVHIPLGAALIFQLVTPATIWTPSQWLTRMFRMVGLKSMDGILTQALYAVPYAWVTFAGMFPLMLFSADATRLVNEYLRDPFLSVFSQIPPDAWLAAAGLGVAAVTIGNRTLRESVGRALGRGPAPVLRCEAIWN